MASYQKPLPKPSSFTAEFWSAAKGHELKIQRCKDCKKHVFYPRPFCSHCISANLEWIKASGKGKVYTYTIVRRAAFPGFDEDVPYVYGIVELEEGPKMTTNIVGVKPEKVHIGMEVEAVFDDVTPEISLVKFKPSSV